MKQKRIAPSLLLLLILPLTSCFGETRLEFKIHNTNALITCIENKDKANIKRFFAPNIVSRVNSLDAQIDALCTYWKGNNGVIAKDLGGDTIEDVDNGHKNATIIYNFIFDIKTSESEYRLITNWRRLDNTDKNNVGLWYLIVDPSSVGKEWNNDIKCEDYEVGITLL